MFSPKNMVRGVVVMLISVMTIFTFKAGENRQKLKTLKEKVKGNARSKEIDKKNASATDDDYAEWLRKRRK